MAATLSKDVQKKIKKIIKNFTLDPLKKADYANMSAQLIALDLQPNNDFIWTCINKVTVETESYDTDFLD